MDHKVYSLIKTHLNTLKGRTQVTILNHVDSIKTNLFLTKGNYNQLWIFYYFFHFHGAYLPSIFMLRNKIYFILLIPPCSLTYSLSLREDPSNLSIKEGNLLRREVLRFWRNSILKTLDNNKANPHKKTEEKWITLRKENYAYFISTNTRISKRITISFYVPPARKLVFLLQLRVA